MKLHALIFGSIIAIISAGCTAGVGNPAGNTDSLSEEQESYFADNDIAMTLSSLADAISVGEPLDTLDYNFEGVLTDGEGHPLYTDIQGSPGMWEVDVLSPESAVIRNLYLGDLLPDDLETYLASTLNLTKHNVVESEEYDDDDDTSLVIYDFGGGYLRFETRAGVAPNGLEGPLMSIIIAKNN